MTCTCRAGPVEAIGCWSGHEFHDACALRNHAAPHFFSQFCTAAPLRSFPKVLCRISSQRLAAFLLDLLSCPHVVYQLPTTGPGTENWSGQSRTNWTASTRPAEPPNLSGYALIMCLMWSHPLHKV